MLFHPRYPFSFDPPFDGCGTGPLGPSYAPDPNLGELAYILDSDPDVPVVCSRLSSVGLNAGTPRDRYDRPYDVQAVIQVGALVDVDAGFSLGGTFADGANRSWMKIYLEEYGSDGSYRGAIEGPRAYIADEGAWFFSWHRTWSVRQHISVYADLPVNPHSRYSVWVDLEGQIAATGYRDRIGGSSAHANVSAAVQNINVFYYLTPLQR